MRYPHSTNETTHAYSLPPLERPGNGETGAGASSSLPLIPTESAGTATSPLRKAAIVLVSVEHSLASQLLSRLDRSAVEAVTWEIAQLESIHPAERVTVLEEFYNLGLRRLCFAFDDLVTMDDRDIRTAFHDQDPKTWALALAAADASVRSKVLSALPAPSADRLRQYLDHLGPFRLSDAQAAQLDITERFRRLHDQGHVSLSELAGEEEVLV